MKLGWWAPWKVTRPWLPRVWRATDEWHNPAISVVLPFLGAFHAWFRNWQDDTDGHFSLSPVMDAPDCPECIAMASDQPSPGTWWSPARAKETA
jgi:hypothetical protein